MRIYTKTGDTGETGLVGGGRVRKNDPRVEAYGTVDELNSHLGIARTFGLPDDLDAVLDSVQNRLFDLGAELAMPSNSPDAKVYIDAEHAKELEGAIDRFEAELPPLNQFILPGGTPLAAQLHVARTVCRRAERCVVTLDEQTSINPELLRYLNRLSDFLFVAARLANHRAGAPDVKWGAPGFRKEPKP